MSYANARPFRRQSMEIGSTAPLAVIAHAACFGLEPLMRRDGRHLTNQNAALNICQNCPVREPCRTWAVETVPDPVPLHVAGGLTPDQRAAARVAVS